MIKYEVKRGYENLGNYAKFKNDKVDYSKAWEKATIYEKAFIVTEAEKKFPGIMGTVVVFIDLFSYPKWDNISEEDQKKLNFIMEELISF